MQEIPSCKSAALRIQCLFGKDKPLFLSRSVHLNKTGEFGKRHKCDLVKTPRITSQVKPASFNELMGKKKLSKKSRTVTKGSAVNSLISFIDPMSCTLSQKNANIYASEKTLSAARVGYHRLKEHILASKHLKTFSRQSIEGPKKHNVTQISLENESVPHEIPHLPEWAKKHEERHFHIERVIKYLSQ
jgi:hypothetical protein